MAVLRDDLRNMFASHKVSDEDARKMALIRNAMRYCAEIVMDNSDGPERTLAIRHLEQAMFYANAGVARKGEIIPIEEDFS